METTKHLIAPIPPLSLQEEFAPFASLRGSSTGVAARAVVEPGRDIESLRGRIGESTRQALGRVCRDLEGLFEALLAQTMDNGR